MGAGAAGAQLPTQLVGHGAFKRNNPMSDKFAMHRFHHFEFYCQDATNTSKRFGLGLGLKQVAKSDQGTGNQTYASYVMQSGELIFAFSAPYSLKTDKSESRPPLPHYDAAVAHDFVRDHGLGVRAVGISVDDAAEAYRQSTAAGGIGVQAPVTLKSADGSHSALVSEVVLYGDVVLRFVSGVDGAGLPGCAFLPGYADTPDTPAHGFGIQRVDHAVGNVPDLLEQVRYMIGAFGFHEFAEFVAEDVGTVDSGLNSMVLANNGEMVLLPVNEPTFGTKRKSQIQTYLEQNGGPGLQHLALKTANIFTTLREMRARSQVGGFEFMPRPSDEYYRTLPERIGDVLSASQYAEVEELGILVDRDDQGVLLQIFTRPLGDRPTVFVEIIQRLCDLEEAQRKEAAGGAAAACPIVEIGGCGGFGKGNFSELFKSIEVYESDLGIN